MRVQIYEKKAEVRKEYFPVFQELTFFYTFVVVYVDQID